MSTSFLFARPSLLRGMARVVDLGGSMGRGRRAVSAHPHHDDFEALLSDWQAVAADMGIAFEETGRRVRHAQEQG